MNFPEDPKKGDTWEDDSGTTWKFNGVRWDRVTIEIDDHYGSNVKPPGGGGSGDGASNTRELALVSPSGSIKTQENANVQFDSRIKTLEENPGGDGVVDPSKLNMVFNTDQIELVDAEGNFCGLHVKGVNGITVTEDSMYGNQTMVIGLPEGFGGGPSLETLPWITIKRFRCDLEGMNKLPVFYATTEVNPLASYFWRWDVDLYNSGNWKDVDDFDSSEQTYFPISMQMEGYLKLTSQTNERYPDARIRYVVWVEDFDGKSSELASSEEPTFVDTEWDQNYEPPLFTDGDGGATVDYASKQYVDEQVAAIPAIPPVDHLVTKDGESTVGSDFRLKQNKNDGSGKNNYLAIHDDYMYLYHVAPPSASHHGVNRQYVDDKIAALRAELNLP